SHRPAAAPELTQLIARGARFVERLKAGGNGREGRAFTRQARAVPPSHGAGTPPPGEGKHDTSSERARRGRAVQLCSRASSTRPWPARRIPSSSAAAWLRSITRLPWNGPRSLIRTTTERPLCVTRTLLPNGSVRCAAVYSVGSKRSPLAVRLP